MWTIIQAWPNQHADITGAVRFADPDRCFQLAAIRLVTCLTDQLLWIDPDQPKCVLFAPVGGDPDC